MGVAMREALSFGTSTISCIVKVDPLVLNPMALNRGIDWGCYTEKTDQQSSGVMEAKSGMSTGCGTVKVRLLC